MRTKLLTGFGGRMRFAQGVGFGLVLGAAYENKTVSMPMIAGAALLVVSIFLPLILRALGWRTLVETVSAAVDGQPPSQRQVEETFHLLLDGGLSREEAIRFVHLNRGWSLPDLWPAVASVCAVSREEAMRLVVQALATLATPLGPDC